MVPMPGASAARMGSRCFDGVGLAADHHAVAAVEAEDAAGGADVDVDEALVAELGGAADVVLVVGVAAVDDDVAFFEQAGEFLDGVLGDVAGGEHDPDGAGLVELLDHVGEAAGAGGAFLGEAVDGLGVAVIDDGLVAGAHEAAADVSAHASEADDP